MKCRRMTWNDSEQRYDIVWFGSKGTRADGTAIFVDENGIEMPAMSADKYAINTEDIKILKPEVKAMVHNNYANDIDAIVESLRQRLSVMKNELWYDYLYGLPLLQKGVTKAMIDSDAILMITYCPGVVSLNKFVSEIDVATKEYKLDFAVTTIYGDASIVV